MKLTHVLLLAVALILPEGVQAAHLPVDRLIVGTWTMSGKNEFFSFHHQLTFHANGTLDFVEENTIDGKRTTTTGTGVWYIQKGYLTVLTREKDQLRTEVVQVKVTVREMTFIDGKEDAVFLRKK